MMFHTLSVRPGKAYVDKAVFRFLGHDGRQAYCRFVLYDDGLMLTVTRAGDAAAGQTEFLSKFVYPEISDLYDGYAWNLDEISCWIQAVDAGEYCDV